MNIFSEVKKAFYRREKKKNAEEREKIGKEWQKPLTPGPLFLKKQQPSFPACRGNKKYPVVKNPSFN